MEKSPAYLEDAARLAALQQASLLDTPVEEAFDRLTRLATRVLGVPISLVSLVDDRRQFFKSAVGLPKLLPDGREMPLSHSFCKHVVLSGKPLIVADAREHPMLKDNPVVPLGVIAYAGIPLVTSDGLVLGSFCAIDTEPHAWTDEQIAVLRDLTAAAITEIELRRSNDELRRTNRAKDRFIAMLSHDLRTPLSPVLLTAAELAQDPNLPEQLREDVKLIHRNVELEVRMIDSLLDLTSITNGKLRLQLEDVDAHAVLRESAAMCGAETWAKSIQVKLDLKARRHGIKADPAKLQQAVCNLLKNAIKFSSSESTISIRSRDLDSSLLRIEISDTGIGIAPALLPQIFEAFDQGERTTAQRFGGLGLGLAICKGIVESHSGVISASSEGRGKGTTITIDLSAATVPRMREAPPPAAGQNTPSALRILLVEDHEDSLRAMARLLRKLDHRVATATCVSEALAAANDEVFDLLISDLGLPDGTGLELMKELLSRRPMKGIALTGYGMDADIQQTKDAGFQKHLTKPINFMDLQKAIGEMG